MKNVFNTYKKDQLTEQYRAIGPASLVAALMAAPRKRSDDKRLHISYLPSNSVSRLQQTTK